MNLKRWAYPITLAVLLLLIAACGRSSEPEATEETVSEAAVEKVEEQEPTTEDVSGEGDAASSSNDSAPAEGMRTFVIVQEESSASFIVQEEFFAGALSKLGINAGNYEVTGTSGDVGGQLQLDLSSEAPLGNNEFTVNLSTFVTDQDRRDNWLLDEGPRFGSAPPAKFVATGIDGAPSEYNEGDEVSFTLNGDLTIKDVTNQVSFAVTATLSGDTVSGTALTESKLTAWNIDPPNFANTLTVADDFKIRFDFTARE